MEPRATIEFVDGEDVREVTFDGMLHFHAGNSPAGVAHAFRVLERAAPILSPDEPPERSEIRVRTAFGGPGARDGIEFATGAVSDGRYEVDQSLARPELGVERERFVFEVSYRERSVTLVLREGFVTAEFIQLARTNERSPDQEGRLDVLKRELAERVMAATAARDVYETSS